MEYLVFWVTDDGVKPINIRIEAITNIKPPTSQKSPTTVYGNRKRATKHCRNSKKIRTILLGKKVRIYTDHKNLTCKNFKTDKVLRWRLIL